MFNTPEQVVDYWIKSILQQLYEMGNAFSHLVGGEFQLRLFWVLYSVETQEHFRKFGSLKLGRLTRRIGASVNSDVDTLSILLLVYSSHF